MLIKHNSALCFLKNKYGKVNVKLLKSALLDFYDVEVVTGAKTQLGMLKMRNMNLQHQLATVEIARHENARNAIVWNTECCICLFIAEQECMSRQEGAPDFAADCVLVND